VVFDGYCNGPSTKDHEHQRRAKKVAPDIALDMLKASYKDQSAFLSNDNNKAAFVALLMTHLELAGHTVYQAKDDADTLVAEVGLKLASQKQVVAVVANDTDILILLLFHFRPADMSDIVMLSQQSQRTTSIRTVAGALGPLIVSRLLVIHAFSGCDTVSGLFGHGKRSIYQKFSKASNVQNLFDAMESLTAGHEEVWSAGSQLLALLYGGSVTDQLNHLRYACYMFVTATSAQLPRPERLPPTENAARYHVFRAHLQILQWKCLSTAVVDAVMWGWKLHEGKYIPIANDRDIAPADLLKVVSCKCRSDARKPCGSQLCMCRKYGLSCISACKNCNGVSCENATEISIDNIADDGAVAEDDGDDDEAAVEVDVFEIDNSDVLDDELIEYYVPWATEEEVDTCGMTDVSL
jgi:hypothetical protein